LHLRKIQRRFRLRKVRLRLIQLGFKRPWVDRKKQIAFF